MRLWLPFALLLALPAVACGDDDDDSTSGAGAAGSGASSGAAGTTATLLCTPGKSEDCTCPGGGKSSQACKSDGSGYDACQCTVAGAGGAGAGGGAGMGGSGGGSGEAGSAGAGTAGVAGLGGEGGAGGANIGGAGGEASGAAGIAQGGAGQSAAGQSGGGQGGAGQGGAAGASGGASGSGGAKPVENVLLYAHTDSQLYQLDTKDLTQLADLGTFDCVGDTNGGQDKAMTDLAVDKDGKLWGVSDTFVHRIELLSDGQTAHCSESIKLKATGTNDATFYGLSFAPIGTLSATKEILVAASTNGELRSVDEQGKVSPIGNLGTVPSDDGHGHTYDKKNVGQKWELSGDILFLANNGSPLGYAIVRDCPSPPSTANCNAVNTLVEIDMSKLGKVSPSLSLIKSVRGQVVPRVGCNDGLGGDYGNVYGIAAWSDRVYGFSRNGHLVDLDTTDGSGCLAHTFKDTKFSGAGVTTLAPVVAPVE